MRERQNLSNSQKLRLKEPKFTLMYQAKVGLEINVTRNLAFALRKSWFKIGILDADIYGPSSKID